MRFDLATIVKRKRGLRRKLIIIRAIQPTGIQATDLYHTGYLPVIDLWRSASTNIALEYERSLSELLTDSASDIGRKLDQADVELSRMFILIRPALNRWALAVETWHRGKWAGAVLSATGVSIDTLIGPADMRETLSAVIERNVALIKSVSDDARKRIADATFRGLSERRPARDVAKEIRAAVEMSRRRALNIASDQIVKIASSLDEERRREAGIDEWKWRHSGKKHPRAEHLARNGNIYSDAKPPDDKPGQLPFCGCTSEAVLRLD